MKEKNKKILFVGGGTLGHIAPSISIIRYLKEHNYEIYYIINKSDMIINYLNNELNNQIKDIIVFNLTGYKRNIFNIRNVLYNFKSINNYIKNLKQIKKALKKINPDLVIGMGGFISGFILKTATRLKFKAIIHEQNAYLGLANKMLVSKVEKVLLSFEIINYNNKYKSKYVIVGNPSINNIKNYLKIKEKQKNILVTSGSNGSTVINDFFIEVSKNMKKYNFTIITGEKNFSKYINSESDNLKLIPFTNEMTRLMKESSIIISRCGSSTIFEILGLEKVSILIPSIYVTNNHQYFNAKCIEKKDQALVLEEKDLELNKVIKIINELEESYNIRKKIIYNIRKDNYYSSVNRFIKEVENII